MKVKTAIEQKALWLYGYVPQTLRRRCHLVMDAGELEVGERSEEVIGAIVRHVVERGGEAWIGPDSATDPRLTYHLLYKAAADSALDDAGMIADEYMWLRPIRWGLWRSKKTGDYFAVRTPMSRLAEVFGPLDPWGAFRLYMYLLHTHVPLSQAFPNMLFAFVPPTQDEPLFCIPIGGDEDENEEEE